MLILTRRVGERIIIADTIQISIMAFRGNQVRLGIFAPDEIAVYREEIYLRMKAEAAARSKLNAQANMGGHHREEQRIKIEDKKTCSNDGQ